MKPYQVHLFSDGSKIPDFLPSEPYFIYEDKKYLNFIVYDCFHLRNNEYLKDVARLEIKENGIVPAGERSDVMSQLEKRMFEIKKLDSIIIFPDEAGALLALFSIFDGKTTFFADYETSASILAVLQHRNIEYYDHNNLEQLGKLLSAKSEKVMIVDGIYDWLGKVAPVNDLMKLANDNECMIIGNEISSFGLLGREGRGFIDFFNLYEAVNIDIGSFSRFIGGFGCYIGAKKYLINKIRENTTELLKPLPQFMLSVDIAGLELIRSDRSKNVKIQTLWKNSRYMITRLKQLGYESESSTPMVVVKFKNNEEAGEFTKRLFFSQVIVAQNKERIRLNLSVEHTKEDIDYCLGQFEAIGQELGIIESH
jgi:7-keto-8-aminopelargonate synthetase-like enzyme